MNILLTVIYAFALAAIGGSICWLMLRANHNRMTYSFIGCQAMIMLWIVSQLLNMYSLTVSQLTISYDIGNLGICFFSSFWLIFSICYTEKEPPVYIQLALMSFSAVMYAIALTNPLHHMYYSRFAIGGVKYAPMFYANQIYIYFTVLTGIIMVCRQCFKMRQRSRGQAVLLTFAVAVPLSLNLLTLADVIKLDFALTPLSFALSSVLILLATYRYGFLNVNSVAFEDALGCMEEGLIVFNKHGKITYISRAAEKLLGVNDGMDYTRLLEYLSDHGGRFAEDFDYGEITRNSKTLSLKRYHHRDEKGVILAFTIIVSDITRYYELIDRTNELAAAEQSLAIEQERNRIAQEVHDTAGHTLTMISSLARLSQVSLGKPETLSDVSELRGYLQETESLARSGITQLRCSINNLRDGTFLTSVTQAIRTLTDAVRDMEVDLCVQGTEDERYEFCARAIYDTCRELITNCVRYAGASRMDIILKLLDKSLELYVFDNGKGCADIKQNNGLRGITQRIEKLGGTASFNSSEGNGFNTIIKIPVTEREG